MVQGLAFLSKKSWHTKNLANQEKVWMAEEREKNEQRKAKELAKEIQIERENEELARLAASAGGVQTRTLDRGIDWMYTGHHKDSETARQDAEKQAEEYLLGKEFRGDSSSIPKGDFAIAESSHAEGLHAVIGGGTTMAATDGKGEPEDSVFQRNEAFRLRIEDPMYAVTQRIAQTEQKYKQRKELYERAGLKVRARTAADEKDENSHHLRGRKHSRKDKKRKRGDDDSNDKHRRKRRHRSPSSNASYSSIDNQEKRQRKSHPPRDRKKPHQRRYSSDDDHRSDNRIRRKRQERRQRRHARDSSPDSRMSSSSSNESYSDRDKYNKRASRRHRSPSMDSYYDPKRNKSSDRSRRKSRHDDDYPRHHRYQSDEEDNPKPSFRYKNEEYATTTSSTSSPIHCQPNNDGYGLQGGPAVNKSQTGHRDLGPDRDLLERKRAMKQAEREKLLSSSKHRHNSSTTNISHEERRAALEAMQRDADMHHTKRSMQSKIYEDDKDDHRDSSKDDVSFLHQIQRQAHGVLPDGGSSISIAERMRQNRHKFQRPHEEEFL
jgi:hypothetical protein